MNSYLNIFIDEEYPDFIDKYINSKTLERIKYVNQFCGCDYTKLYKPAFIFSRFYHSLVVAHMTWHFKKDKASTIAALSHDVGTPCFSHVIDFMYEDYEKQETSEINIVDVIKKDEYFLDCLKKDNLDICILDNLEKYSVLENKSPKLCTDRLDGVFHTGYIWLCTHTCEQIKEIYDDMLLLTNEDNVEEIGFKTISIAEKFVDMVSLYAKELQSNTDKYIMKYVGEVVKLAIKDKHICLNDLYTMKEEDIVKILASNYSSWKIFNEANELIHTNEKPDNFYVHLDCKKRNTIPLVQYKGQVKRINEVSEYANNIYHEISEYHDTDYGYIKKLRKIC